MKRINRIDGIKNRVFCTVVLGFSLLVLVSCSHGSKEISENNEGQSITERPVDVSGQDAAEESVEASTATVSLTPEERLLKEAIDNIDFGESQAGSNLTEEENRAYLQGYQSILRNEILLRYDTGLPGEGDHTEYYKDLYLGGIPYWERLEARNKTEFPYGLYYNDFDGDGEPELTVYEGCLYMIKYEPGDDVSRIIYECGDAVQDATDFAGFIGMGIWYHYVYEDQMIDSYERPNAQGRWERVLSLTQSTNSADPYYKIYVSGQDAVEVRKEVWEELTEGFYAAAENLLLPLSLEELFGEELDETDPLLAGWDGIREYEGFWEFWENTELPYADDATYAVIKAAYEDVDFYGEYEEGDSTLYDEYKERYFELIQSAGAVLDKETGEFISIADLPDYWGSAGPYDWRELEYYFFDADGDQLPELIIYDDVRACHAIDYDPDTGIFMLWYPMNAPRYSVIGTRKVVWIGETIYSFYQLDQNGEEELTFSFSIYPWSQYIKGYLVELPNYTDDERDIVVTEEMRQFGTYARNEDSWYFRITEAQYEELTAPYWEAFDAHYEELEEVTYTYDELFADYDRTQS